MSKLKNYMEFLNEDEEVTTSQPEPKQNTSADVINKLFTDLKSVVQNKIAENKKLINSYYNKTTKDGEEINTTDEFYTYGRYNGNERVENANMTFVIKFNEMTESGLTFNIISSLDMPELKNVESNQVEIIKKSTDGSTKFNPGYINGKYVVKNKEKINILKPKEERTEEKSIETNEAPTKNDNGVTIGVGKFYEYEKEKGKPSITVKVIGINKDKTFQVQCGTAQWTLNTKELFNKIKKEVSQPTETLPKRKLIPGKIYSYNNTKAKIVQILNDGKCKVSIDNGSPVILSKEETDKIGELIK